MINKSLFPYRSGSDTTPSTPWRSFRRTSSSGLPRVSHATHLFGRPASHLLTSVPSERPLLRRPGLLSLPVTTYEYGTVWDTFTWKDGLSGCSIRRTMVEWLRRPRDLSSLSTLQRVVNGTIPSLTLSLGEWGFGRLLTPRQTGDSESFVDSRPSSLCVSQIHLFIVLS